MGVPEIRLDRIAAGQCEDCGRPRVNARHCEECRQRHGVAARNSYRRKQGLPLTGDLLRRGGRGERNGNAKLKEADIPVILGRLAAGETHRAIAMDYGVAPLAITQINLSKTWKHIPRTARRESS